MSTGTVSVGGGPVDGATVRLDRPLMGGGVTLDQTVTDSIGAYRFIITGNPSELCTIIAFEISLVAELQDGRQILHQLGEAVPPDCAESLTLGQSVTIVIDFDFPAPLAVHPHPSSSDS